MVSESMNPFPSSSKCLLFLFVLVWCSCSQSMNAQKAATDPSEVRALNSIFQQWGLQATESWNISGEPCSGSAVNTSEPVFMNPSNSPAIRCECYITNKTLCHITGLIVVGLNRRGMLPEELLDLPFLTVLGIDHNFFSGPLPAFMGKMSRLEFLSIGYNEFSGLIPKELGNLEELRTLILSVNNFNGTLPPELGNLVNLERLYIDSCGLGEEIPSTFANLVNLQIFSANDNAFTGKIPDFVGNNWTKLTGLRFQGNSFEGPIPSSFANLKSLGSLRIGDIYNGSSSLAFVRNLKKLTDLVLRNALLTGSLPSYITELQSLQKLDLSFNNLTGTIPNNMFTMGSLQYLFLGNNSLTGAIPNLQTTTIQTIDLSYNLLIGDLPSSVDRIDQLNLVGNNFTPNSSNIGIFPGLECLQRSFPCSRNAPRYANFSIKCGGPQMVSNGIVFEADNRSLGAATYDVTGTKKWAVSNVGFYEDGQNQHYVQTNFGQVRGTNTPELYRSSRQSSGSLRYYGLGLENGLYTVNLFFAETGFPDRTSQSWMSLTRRVFDVYIQGILQLKDFDISKEAGGVERAIIKNFTATISRNHLEIHLFWAGKGTPDTPEAGPSISAISVVPNFIPTIIGSTEKNRTAASEKNKPKEKNGPAFIVGLTVSVVVLSLILILALVYAKRKRKDEWEEVLPGICTKPDTFSFSELKAITEDFSPSKKLGEGGFGAVYKENLTLTTSICIVDYSFLNNMIRFLTLHAGKLCPKISDFGLAKLCDDNKSHISTRVAGTIGYMAPEYALRGHLTEKADVFSFGIVALEILSGRPNSDNSLNDDKIYLLGWAWDLHENNRSLDLVDPNLAEIDENEALRVVMVALLCTQGSPSMRPPMSRIVAMLAGDIEANGVITRPSYLTDWNFRDLTGSLVTVSCSNSNEEQPQ
ncbi:hypothetical protein V6N12_024908 [Hibiscus sabdariffa]|uniref:non-specific serine/threonine protein kinase n=1 Tax=Hibiscus sabdariffa TaxID=183260 RepID=A0ABR1ZXY8_9ROSI